MNNEHFQLNFMHELTEQAVDLSKTPEERLKVVKSIMSWVDTGNGSFNCDGTTKTNTSENKEK